MYESSYNTNHIIKHALCIKYE